MASDVPFEAAWRAKVAWGAHAQQSPCRCSLDGVIFCPIGASLHADYMRLANIANGLLSGRL